MPYLIAEYIVWMMKEKTGALKAYGGVIAVLTIILNLVFWAVTCGSIPDSIFHGKHAADNIAMLHALETSTEGFGAKGLYWLCFVWTMTGVIYLFKALKKKDAKNIVGYTLWTIIALFIMLDSTLQPPVLNTKADKQWAPVIERKFDKNKLYSYMSVDMLHFFSLNFYLDDRIQQFDKVMPQDGVLMIPETDMPGFREKYDKDYIFQKVWEIPKAVESKDPVGFYRFVKTTANVALN